MSWYSKISKDISFLPNCIEYFYKDEINPHIHRFARCALTNMSVEYGGEQFVTFEDGSPVEINMSLTFQELEQMTSEGITQNEY